jgi:E3 ubiquitin-protein ligase UBR1
MLTNLNYRCGGKVGIFLHIRKCTILYLHEHSGSFTVAPYLDKFGEADPSLRSNLQLFLNQKRYDAIFKTAWLQHQIPSIIARRLEGEISTGGWESL